MTLSRAVGLRPKLLELFLMELCSRIYDECMCSPSKSMHVIGPICSGYIAFHSEVACSTTVIPKSPIFEVARYSDIFQSLDVKHYCKINLRL